MARVAIVRGNNPYETTKKALNLIRDDIKIEGSQALLKPNLLTTAEKSLAVTSPHICAAVADFLRDDKQIIDIQLGEGTTSGSPPNTFVSMRNNGYTDYLDRWEPVDFARDVPKKWFPIESPGILDEIQLGIAKTAIECPYLVSIPKFKTHDVLGLTLSLKNLMGTLTAARNFVTKKFLTQETSNVCGYMHGYGELKPDKLADEQIIGPSKVALAINLLRLAKIIQPSLAVVDGIEAMEGDGPLSGTKKDLNLVITGTDFIAVDIVASHIAGFDPDHFQYLYQAGLLGLGECNIENITILGESLDSVCSPFKPHHLYPRAKFTPEEITTLKHHIS